MSLKIKIGIQASTGKTREILHLYSSYHISFVLAHFCKICVEENVYVQIVYHPRATVHCLPVFAIIEDFV